MQQLFKRMLSVLLAVAVLLSLTVTAFAADDGADAALTAADYAAADALFNALEDVEQTAARRDASADGRTQAICDYLNAQDAVVPGSVETSGERINWMTEQGIACAYSPRLEQIAAAAEPTADDTPDVQTRSYAARGTQHGRDVYLFQPYYGVDRSFTEQYQKEAQRVAQASEGTYHYYKGDAATIDAVADAITDGGVVFFDSHGSTDYENGEDYTSGATTSYLCLQTGDGLTKADYDGGHAVYSSTSGSMKYFLVDGTVIADHMDADAQANNGLLWMAICLGMATDGLEKPLMDRGLGAVYGYSQSVTFVGDYTFEAVFFDSLLGGSTVAEAITDMKTACGAWDCSPQICQANGMSANYQMTTLEEAQRGRAAFPIVVSADDTYPGHGNVDALQDVNSGWALLDRYALTADTDTPEHGSVTQRGMTVTANANTGYYASGYTVTPEGAATVLQNGNTFRISALRQDCKVTIHFAAKTPAAVHFSVPDGVTQPDVAGYIGDPITLPQPTGTPTADAQDYHFVGWTTEPVETPAVSARVSAMMSQVRRQRSTRSINTLPRRMGGRLRSPLSRRTRMTGAGRMSCAAVTASCTVTAPFTGRRLAAPLLPCRLPIPASPWTRTEMSPAFSARIPCRSRACPGRNSIPSGSAAQCHRCIWPAARTATSSIPTWTAAAAMPAGSSAGRMAALSFKMHASWRAACSSARISSISAACAARRPR